MSACHLRLLVSAVPLLFVVGSAPAATFRVPSEHPTIQAAVDAAADGDTVRVAPGTYHDCTHADADGTLNCVIVDKAILLLADSSREDTVIDAGGLGRVVRFGDAADEAEIRGFTVQGGRITGMVDGGGVLVGPGAHVTIRECRIRDNTSRESPGSPLWGAVHGGGVGVSHAHATVVDSELWDNLTDSAGGGLATIGGRATLVRCDVRRNRAGGGGGLASYLGRLDMEACTIAGNVAGNGGGLWWAPEDWSGGVGYIRDSRIVGNRANYRGGGLYLQYSWAELTGTVVAGNSAGYSGGGAHLDAGDLALTQCTIAGNSAEESGGGVAVTYYDHGSSGLGMRSGILWGNCAPLYPEAEVFYSSLTFEHCVVDTTGVTGYSDLGGNLCVDPLFCAPAPCDEAPTVEGKYSLESGSPCLVQPGVGRIGAEGKGCETVAVTPTSWAAVKALYR